MTNLIKIAKRLDSLKNYIVNNKPNDNWIIINYIYPQFLQCIKTDTTQKEEDKIIEKLEQLLDSYEFRFGRNFENKNYMSRDLEILKMLLLAEAEEDEQTDNEQPEEEQEVEEEPKEEPKPGTFEADPMSFILKKYVSLNTMLSELMTPSFKEYVEGVFIVAPKPTTFKVVLHNGQYFFLTYLGKAYQATIAGRNYYLIEIGEKERCMIAISKLLRYGSPLKTKGPEGAEQGTRDVENTGMEGDWAANGGAGGGAAGGDEGGGEEIDTTAGAEEGGEELTEAIKLIRTILLREAAKPTTAANKEVVSILTTKYPDKFGAQSAKDRISNKTKMQSSEFEKIIKKEVKAKNIKVHPPKTGPNDSSKFDMFEFDTQFGPAAVYLSAGAEGNEGSKFEKDLVDRIKAVAGVSKNKITDTAVLTVLDALQIDPKLLDADEVIAAGETDTKRPLNFKGPQNRGQKISDIIINYKGKPYYLSIKNVKGSGIYNGGLIPGITYNKDKTKIVFDEAAFNSNENTKKIFEIFGADPKKLVKGLNNYINQVGSDTAFQPTKGDIDLITKLLGSAIDYGYYYIREIPGGDVKVYNINSPKKAMELLGTPTSISIKYPSKATKIATFRVELKDSELGLKRADVSIRNATGGVDKPVLKINLF